MALPDPVLRKLYYQNALKMVPDDFGGRASPARQHLFPTWISPPLFFCRSNYRWPTISSPAAPASSARISRGLARRGEPVRVVDNLITGKPPEPGASARVEFIDGDWRTRCRARGRCSGID